MIRGKNTHFTNAMSVLVWALMRKNPPTLEDIMDRWDVCRATAYRWRNELAVYHAQYSIKTKEHTHEEVVHLSDRCGTPGSAGIGEC